MSVRKQFGGLVNYMVQRWFGYGPLSGFWFSLWIAVFIVQIAVVDWSWVALGVGLRSQGSFCYRVYCLGQTRRLSTTEQSSV